MHVQSLIQSSILTLFKLWKVKCLVCKQSVNENMYDTHEKCREYNQRKCDTAIQITSNKYVLTQSLNTSGILIIVFQRGLASLIDNNAFRSSIYRTKIKQCFQISFSITY